jgi:hypothetical protein
MGIKLAAGGSAPGARRLYVAHDETIMNARLKTIINIPMNYTRCLTIVVFYAVALHFSSALAMHSGLPGFSSDFLHDYNAAQERVNESKSAEPLLALLAKYTNATETAELQLSIGLVYGQRTGLVDPAKAVAHFTAALRYELPERAYIEVLMWRGNSQEQLKQTREALNDYLRGLLACSYHDLSGGWPELQRSKVPIYLGRSLNGIKPDPENDERLRDYNRYRQSIDFQQFLLMQRYYLVEAVKRVTNERSGDRAEIMEILGTLTPDSSRFGVIRDWLNSENKRPWP